MRKFPPLLSQEQTMEAKPEQERPDRCEASTREMIQEALQDLKALEVAKEQHQQQQQEQQKKKSDGEITDEECGSFLDDEWYGLLQKCLESPEFLNKLESLRSYAQQQKQREGQEGASDSEQKSERESENGQAECNVDVEEIVDKEFESYVFVTKEDAVESMATIIASCIVACPESKNLNSRELQCAVVNACDDLKKTKLKSMWMWGRFLYRTLAIGYSAFKVFQHPWLVKAIAVAVWQVQKALVGFIL